MAEKKYKNMSKVPRIVDVGDNVYSVPPRGTITVDENHPTVVSYTKTKPAIFLEVTPPPAPKKVSKKKKKASPKRVEETPPPVEEPKEDPEASLDE